MPLLRTDMRFASRLHYRNCLFRALADQLEGHSQGHLRLRQETVQYMMSHRQDFEPFVEDDVPFTKHGEKSGCEFGGKNNSTGNRIK